MALIECQGCGQRISSRASNCPKCGYSSNCVKAEDVRIKSGNPTNNRASTTGPVSASPINADTSTIPSNNATPPPQPGKQKPAEEWYFVSPSGRNGPVNREFIQKLAAAGQINPETLIWKTGMQDWIRFAKLDSVTEEPVSEEQQITPAKPCNLSVWALALAPLWALIIQILATEARVSFTHKTLDYYSEMWWIVILINILASYMDSLNSIKSTNSEEKFGPWLFLLVPLYLYRREKLLSSNMLKLWVWIGSCAISVATLISLSMIYLKISS